MTPQDRPATPAHIVEQFDGSSRSAQRILVVHAELVDVQPFSEFGGWWDRGLRQ